MPTARDGGGMRATPATSRCGTLIGTCAAFDVGSALPYSWATCASTQDAVSQFGPTAGLSASRATLHRQNDIITEIAKEACHRANGTRIVMHDAALASRWRALSSTLPPEHPQKWAWGTYRRAKRQRR